MDTETYNFNSVPARTGIGLKGCHYTDVLERQPNVGWFEVHPENYMGAGGPSHYYLSEIRNHYPLSLHGVGLSLGSAGSLNTNHLMRLAKLIERYDPGLISEHLAWCEQNGRFFNDLLPTPLNAGSLDVMVSHVMQTQETLGRQILVENPSTYLQPAPEDYDEPGFLKELAQRTGCGLLLDINNVFVSASNHKFSAHAYLDDVPPHLVQEVHLAGHTVQNTKSGIVRIDDHGSRVCDAVWDLFHYFMERRSAPVPVLIEWDTDVPTLDLLLEEAARADATMEHACQSTPSDLSHDKIA
ncbi:MAG: DUF692 domain-containing protein [Parvularculales bacterium]